MKTLYRVTLALRSPLGTPLAGDTLFGQMCWALRESAGESELTHRIDGYCDGDPWLVVSDGFPAGHLPKPTLPQHFEAERTPEQRKVAKGRRWIPGSAAGHRLPALLASAVDDAAAYGAAPQRQTQAHNTIDRQTGTTGEGVFAPYSQSQTTYGRNQQIDLYLVFDPSRSNIAEIRALLAAIGQTGYGRDASTGLGKFDVSDAQAIHLPLPEHGNAYWTLASCAPQGLGFDAQRSYWRVHTRFGRHGNAHALGGRPFKNPILLAAAGAILTPTIFTPRLYIGQGLGGQGLDGQGRLSRAEPATVQQGYAPVLPIGME